MNTLSIRTSTQTSPSATVVAAPIVAQPSLKTTT